MMCLLTAPFILIANVAAFLQLLQMPRFLKRRTPNSEEATKHD